MPKRPRPRPPQRPPTLAVRRDRVAEAAFLFGKKADITLWKSKESAPRVCSICGSKEQCSAGMAVSLANLRIPICCEPPVPFRRLRQDLPLIYTQWDYPSKRAFREAWFTHKRINVLLPINLLRPKANRTVPDGKYAAEGPHYPQLAQWVAVVDVEDGHVIKFYG